MDMTTSLTLYKLIVLYMLRRIEFSMTLAQISEFVLGKDYTDYFTLTSSLGELEDAGLVHTEKVRNSTFYTITPEGEEAVDFFRNRISPDLRADIVGYLKVNRLRLRDETAARSDYRRLSSGEYEVRCTLREQDTEIVDLKLVLPLKEQAEEVANRWEERHEDVYAYIMQELLMKE